MGLQLSVVRGPVRDDDGRVGEVGLQTATLTLTPLHGHRRNLETIDTSDVVPADLNAILCKVELVGSRGVGSSRRTLPFLSDTDA